MKQLAWPNWHIALLATRYQRLLAGACPKLYTYSCLDRAICLMRAAYARRAFQPCMTETVALRSLCLFLLMASTDTIETASAAPVATPRSETGTEYADLFLPS